MIYIYAVFLSNKLGSKIVSHHSSINVVFFGKIMSHFFSKIMLQHGLHLLIFSIF